MFGKRIACKIVKEIVSVAKPDKIILFGSYVYGNPDEDSDVDILVIKRNIKSKIGEYFKIRKSLKGLRFPCDIIVVTPAEYEFYSTNWKNSVFAEAKEKGSVIYEKRERIFSSI